MHLESEESIQSRAKNSIRKASIDVLKIVDCGCMDGGGGEMKRNRKANVTIFKEANIFEVS